MPLRAVIFDVGGVLVRMADWRQHRKWEGRLRLSDGELLKIVFGSEWAVRAEVGQISGAVNIS